MDAERDDEAQGGKKRSVAQPRNEGGPTLSPSHSFLSPKLPSNSSCGEWYMMSDVMQFFLVKIRTLTHIPHTNTTRRREAKGGGMGGRGGWGV